MRIGTCPLQGTPEWLRVKESRTNREKAIVHLRRAFLLQTRPDGLEAAKIELRAARELAGVWQPYIFVGMFVNAKDTHRRGSNKPDPEFCKDLWFNLSQQPANRFDPGGLARMEESCGKSPFPLGTIPAEPRKRVVDRQSSDYLPHRAKLAAGYGRYKEARELLAEARRMLHDKEDALEIQYVEYLLALREARLSDALSIAEAIDRESPPPHPTSSLARAVLGTMVSVAARKVEEGDLQGAEVLLKEVRPRIAPGDRHQFLRVEATIAKRQGRWADAVRHLEELQRLERSTPPEIEELRRQAQEARSPAGPAQQ
ncbi:MAG: hypothetical protein HYZ28_11710 [Myxococcales bacterium]|nr:hypothetical protein [Myxococcales bacterium]